VLFRVVVGRLLRVQVKGEDGRKNEKVNWWKGKKKVDG
jgi:hypothetical protein